MKLYPYQKLLVEEAIKNFKTTDNQMIVVPTGGGKTVIFSTIIKNLDLKTLIIAHTTELINQIKKTLKIMSIDCAEVATIQKVYINLELTRRYDFLIIDECHRSQSTSYLKLIDIFQGKKVLGVTATPFRHDGKKLNEIYGKKISSMTLIRMIEEGFLCDFAGYRIRTNLSLKGISTKNGEFIATKLASVINVKNRNELIVREYKNIAFGEKAVCFAANVAHAQELAKCFIESGVSSYAIHGKLSKNERIRVLESFKNGHIRVLVNCNILTEGFDEPSITCLLMARPTKSKVLYTQMIGRGSRIFPGKSICKVIEFTDNDHDVSCLEELISPSGNRRPFIQGESLTKYEKRIKDLLEDSKETVIEQMQIIPKSIYEKGATLWQREFLKSMKIQFFEPLTEFTANQLIIQATNGKH